MERIAIKRVPAAWKCSVKNIPRGPYGANPSGWLIESTIPERDLLKPSPGIMKFWSTSSLWMRRLASHLAKKRPLDRPDASWVMRLVRGIGIRPIIFSVNCYIATILALFISFSLDLKSPAWAMTTVYLTSQPLSGALRAKAVYRVIGTFVGGAAMIAIVPNLVDAPELTTLAIILWVSLCVFVSLLDRTPRS